MGLIFVEKLINVMGPYFSQSSSLPGQDHPSTCAPAGTSDSVLPVDHGCCLTHNPTRLPPEPCTNTSDLEHTDELFCGHSQAPREPMDEDHLSDTQPSVGLLLARRIRMCVWCLSSSQLSGLTIHRTSNGVTSLRDVFNPLELTSNERPLQ
ncbi:hypothetical protein BC628DRAFT_899901 [Trametes gibbosa]|nr:hypothetical protein BC628DRAFT_899901 [Trametes gibbosa]